MLFHTVATQSDMKSSRLHYKELAVEVSSQDCKRFILAALREMHPPSNYPSEGVHPIL